jgi:hypothetical protein
MLPPFIIDQIRQREKREQKRRDDARPRLELPLGDVPAQNQDPDGNDDDPDRGIVIVDLMG